MGLSTRDTAPDPSKRTRRSAEDSESATHTVPEASCARPEGWANQDSVAAPSRRPSSPVPASTASRPVRGSKENSWCVPAIAITRASTAVDHNRSHGEDSATSVGAASAGTSFGSTPRARASSRSRCTPLPARVRTAPVDSSTPRRR